MEEKKSVFLIDLLRDEDYDAFLRETQSGGKIVLYSNKFSPYDRKRYLIVDWADGYMYLYWGSDNELCPFGDYKDKFRSVTKEAICIQQFFDIADILTVKLRKQEAKPYIVKRSDEIMELLKAEGFKIGHPNGYWLTGGTPDLIEVYPRSKRVIDWARKDSENITQEAFIEIAKSGWNERIKEISVKDVLKKEQVFKIIYDYLFNDTGFIKDLCACFDLGDDMIENRMGRLDFIRPACLKDGEEKYVLSMLACKHALRLLKSTADKYLTEAYLENLKTAGLL